MTATRSLLATALAASLGVAACGGSDTDTTPVEAPASEAEASDDDSTAGTDAQGIRVAAPEVAAATIEDAPEDLVILDVRTQEEFDEAHIDGAVMLDFYRDDFAEELAQLDPDVPYVLYCRSGNRSGSTRALMDELGFTSVEDVDGGIIGWLEAGLPVVTG